jgi:hypothetical protein
MMTVLLTPNSRKSTTVTTIKNQQTANPVC